jgi:hypothetical protein
MTSDADRFWEEVAKKLRRAKGFSIPTPEEAEAELDAAEEEPLTDEQINGMVEAAVSGELAAWTPTPDLSWMGETNDSTIEDELFALNRNRGEEDQDVDEILEEQRREALGDDVQQGSEERDGQSPSREAPGDGD